MAVEESIDTVLAHLTQQAERTDEEYPYETLFVETDLPLEALAKVGKLSPLNDGTDSDQLPALCIQMDECIVEMDVCPFGHLVLLSAYEHVNTDKVKQILEKNRITIVPLEVLNAMPEWHGFRLINWLFPQRLSEVLALFDMLRSSR